MAKIKIKLDVAAVKHWLLEHGEKLAFGFTLLIFLLFTWSAISREVMTKQPPQLQTEADAVSSHVKSFHWDDKAKELAGVKIERYDEKAKRTKIVATAFALPVPLNSPLADPKTIRIKPELFPVEELKVAAGFGTFALRAEGAVDPPAGQARPAMRGGVNASSRLKGLPWVAITGLIPVQKQAQEYSRVFSRALGGNHERDVPRYSGFKIERAEINPADPAKLDWKPLPQAPVVKEFEQGPAEVVAADFVDPTLTMPLRPLIGAAWGDAVTHPRIALADPRNAPAPPPVVEDAPKDDAPKDADDGFQGAGARKAATPVAAAAAAKTQEAEFGYRLFRGFDFSVEPNKKYRYRVVVRLQNPNFGVPRHYLQDPDMASQEHILTAATEPSPPISVPDGYQVLAGAVKMKLSEPLAKFMLIAIDKEVGIEATVEQDFQRGAVANTVQDVKVVDPHTQKSEEKSGMQFKSDMVVLDIRGWKPVSKSGGSKFTAPGEVLLLDRNGDLVVRRELEDLSLYESRKPPEATEEKTTKGPDPLDPPKRPARPPRVRPQR